jgi:uncharacterized protein YqeY
MSNLQKLKSTFGIKSRKKVSHETLKDIARMIKEEHLDWAELNDDILIMLLKFVILQYPTETFNEMSEQELREKIRNAFISSTQIHKDLKEIATPDQIQKLNEAYMNGRKLGASGKSMLGAVMGKLKKTIKIPRNIDDDQLHDQ